MPDMNVFSKMVHPHGRGDNCVPALARKVHCGSPPRAWGQSATWSQYGRNRRFTPTGVGTILEKPRFFVHQSVHPHGRGDNRLSSYLMPAPHGSPPRAWGQCKFVGFSSKFPRFTPTGVGTIRPTSRTQFSNSVHPHGRGDNAGMSIPMRMTCGSPPRAWGQLTTLSTAGMSIRFTPTGVGTITSCLSRRAPTAVHPHGRGDNEILLQTFCRWNGSPPRAWGQCRVCLLDRVARRFTPTGVGTIPDVDRAARFWNGSPPRAWGQLRQHVDAGGSALVHPHGRGDNDNRVQSAYACSWFTPTGVGTMLASQTF